jgi:hypothetical protein
MNPTVPQRVIDEAVEADPASAAAEYMAQFRTDDAGEWPREKFKELGIRYESAAKPKSDLYKDALAILNSNKADLLDSPRLIAQLCGLERRTARGGRDSVDHQPVPNFHDDVSNCWAGLVAELAIRGDRFGSSYKWVGGPDPNDPAPTWATPPSLWQHPNLNLLRGPGLIRGGRTRG